MAIAPTMIITVVINAKLGYPLLNSFRKYVWCSSHSTLAKLVDDSLLGCVFDPIVIPLTAGASLPWRGAEVAEASATPAGDMEASLAQLYNGMTAGARLPMLCECESSNFKHSYILGADLICMGCVFAARTDHSIALTTNHVGPNITRRTEKG